MDWKKLDGSAPILAFAGGIASILSVFQFMEKLSFSAGAYHEALSIVSAYNISPSSSLLSMLSQSTAITVALYVTYAMLPFSVIIFTIGALWLFSKSHMQLTAVALAISSLMIVLLSALMEYMMDFNGYATFAMAYAGGIAGFAAGAQVFLSLKKPHGATRAVGPININPETPYTNILTLSKKLMSKLSGELKILDMHFDATGLQNLSRLLSGNLDRYRKVMVLTRRERLGKEFLMACNEFRSELGNRGIEFELKVMKEEDAVAQHERMLMDGSTAYKIPPLNIINRKSEHIVSINHREAEERFDRLWLNSTKFA
jgi:hypothetical protein